MTQRFYLAWSSIVRDEESLDLGAFARNQAQGKRQESDETVDQRLQEAMSWALVPSQPDPNKDQGSQEIRIQGSDSPVALASRKLINEEHLITTFGAARLRLELDKYLWGDKEHLGLKQLWEFFCTYTYLPRLRDSEVLLEAVQDGISRLTWQENFAFAEAWDEEKEKYLGLVAGKAAGVILDSASVLVKPEVAAKQLEKDGEPPSPGPPRGPGDDDDEPDGPTAPPEKAHPRRYYGTAKLDSNKASLSFDQVAQEVIQHLQAHGADVELSLEIEARSDEGFPDQVLRTVNENARVLKFDNSEFEEE